MKMKSLARKVTYKTSYETKSYWYAWNVVEGNITACNDVINACNRFLRDLESSELAPYKYYIDLDQMSRIENASRCLKFTAGGKAGQFVDIAPPQAFVLDNLYAWRFKDNPNKRRFRSSFIMKSRKNAKTFDMAMISILSMLDEQEAEVVSVAKLLLATINRVKSVKAKF